MFDERNAIEFVLGCGKVEDNQKIDKRRTLLVGERDIKELDEGGRVHCVSKKTGLQVNSLTHKEIGLRSRGLAILDSGNKIVYQEDNSHLQHFFPILIRDFAKLAYEYTKSNKPLPIVSVDSHDVIGCDFCCQDCLSGGGLLVAKSGINKGFSPALKSYIHILSEIAEYSKRRGVDSVRFEQSGEGNPDLYALRPKLIKEAKKRHNMQTVYVTTGSQMSEELAESLVDNAAFIRISFPGIDPRTYALYSNQKKYTFNDSIARLKKLIKMRAEAGREQELLIGARVALRPEEELLYYDFGKLMKKIGVDCVQLVKILVPNGLKCRNFPISATAIRQLEKLKTLSDEHFCVAMPNVLDYLYYARYIKDRSNFTDVCYSSRIQPVLTGNGLFVCTKSEVMYSKEYLFGSFKGKKGEIEQFLSKKNVDKVTKNVPASCYTCGNIFDNLLFDKMVKLARQAKGPLSFYEVISY